MQFQVERLARLKRQFLKLVILASHRQLSNSVFDASDKDSPALDFRVCFPELVCPKKMAYSARKALVSRLEKHWHSKPSKGWRTLIQQPQADKSENP